MSDLDSKQCIVLTSGPLLPSFFGLRIFLKPYFELKSKIKCVYTNYIDIYKAK